MTEGEMVGCIIESMDMRLSKLWEIVKDREAWLAAVDRVTKSRTRLSAQQQEQQRALRVSCYLSGTYSF